MYREEVHMTMNIFSEWLCSRIQEESQKDKPRFTQASLSRELKVNRSTVNHWCKGTRIPCAKLKERIAKSSLFDVSSTSCICWNIEPNLIKVLLLCHNQKIYEEIFKNTITDDLVDEIMDKPEQTDEDIEILTDWVLQEKSSV